MTNKDLKNFLKYSCTKCGICFEDNQKEINRKHYNKLENNLNKTSFLNYCPGIGINRKKIDLDSKQFDNYFGYLNQTYVGFSNDDKQRYNSSSGGIITEVIVYLLSEKILDGVLMPFPADETETEHHYKICTSKDLDDIRRFAQSIYKKIPLNNLNEILLNAEGKIGFIGMPDQIAGVRALSTLNKNIKKKIKFFIGPIVGILMENEASNMIPKIANTNEKIEKLRWRHGEWPGNLFVKFRSKEFIMKKFYYNYLLPFYCSNESLFHDDFYNELADISVGDAWLPEYENQGKGWSLVVAKTNIGEEILNNMKNKNKIYLEKISYLKALRMHEHMVDFKKRGSKYRKKILKMFNIKTPDHYNFVINYKYSRYLIEIFILLIIFCCKTKLARWFMSRIKPSILGNIFSILRIIWKKMTKSIKRKDLYDNVKSN